MDYLEHIGHELHYVVKLLARRQDEMYHLQYKLEFLKHAYELFKKEPIRPISRSVKKITKVEQLDMLAQ